MPKGDEAERVWHAAFQVAILVLRDAACCSQRINVPLGAKLSSPPFHLASAAS
jgi:hypothetical protein